VCDEWDLSVLDDSRLKLSHQCVKAVSEANRALGMIKKNSQRRMIIIFQHYIKSLARQKLEYCIKAWNPFLRKRYVQHCATKLITVFGNKTIRNVCYY